MRHFLVLIAALVTSIGVLAQNPEGISVPCARLTVGSSPPAAQLNNCQPDAWNTPVTAYVPSGAVVTYEVNNIGSDYIVGVSFGSAYLAVPNLVGPMLIDPGSAWVYAVGSVAYPNHPTFVDQVPFPPGAVVYIQSICGTAAFNDWIASQLVVVQVT